MAGDLCDVLLTNDTPNLVTYVFVTNDAPCLVLDNLCVWIFLIVQIQVLDGKNSG